jgi:hypothetical protein
MTARALRTALLSGAAIVAFSWFTVVTEGFAAPDESWFLQVVARVQSGETLYRDVYFNATPLSVYLTLALTSIFPTELLLVRSVVAAALAATVALCWLLCRALGVGRLAPWLLVSSWVQPAPYTPVAMVFFAGTFAATVWWMRTVQHGGSASRMLVLAAASAGLCFTAKQNLGVYCLAAVLISVVAVANAGVAARRALLVVLGVFFVTSAGVLLPVFVAGGLERFLVYGFSKTTYLKVGSVPYSAALERFRSALAGEWSYEALAAAYREFAFLLAPAVFALLVTACWRSRSLQRQTAVVVTTFVAAGYLVVFPQPGGSSNTYAIPLLVVGLAYGWQTARPFGTSRWAPLVPVAVTVLFSTQVGLRLVRYTSALVSAQYVTSEIPHFRGIRVSQAEYTRLRDEAGRLSTLTADRRLFLLGPHAGFYYLAGGLTNPDPFDFPYASVFGRAGQDEVISRIRAHQIRSVFVFFAPMGAQTPATLQHFVGRSMVPVRREHFGVLYSSPPRPPSRD